jgi:hypothetical protein
VADPETWIRVTNGGASPVNVTVTPPASGGARGSTAAPQIFGPVPITTGDRVFGPFPPNPYADQNGNVNISTSPTGASVKIGVFKFSG